MKKIYQTKFSFIGNCFQAAVASLFEVELNEVPDLHPESPMKGEEQIYILNKWLQEYNLRYIELGIPEEKVEKMLKDVYHLIIGTSPRNVNKHHVVVGKSGLIVHDPHPSNSGVAGYFKYGVFVEMDMMGNYHNLYKKALI